jgi:hypothetical protein
MSRILELSKEGEAAVALPAPAAQMPAEQYLVHIVELAVENRRRIAAEQLGLHLEEMAECIAPETTSEQMEAALQDALAAIRPQRAW